MKKLIIILFLLSVLFVAGCSAFTENKIVGNTNFDRTPCITICSSHANWTYTKQDWEGWGRYVCYCQDEKGAIWVFDI